MSRVARIPCDDGSGNTLILNQSNDGDIWVAVIDRDGIGLGKTVRICTAQGAGDKKMEVRAALQDALEAAIKAGF